MTEKEFERRYHKLAADWDSGKLTADEYDRQYLALCADSGLCPDWTWRHGDCDPRGD
jgi:hypothetical protein